MAVGSRVIQSLPILYNKLSLYFPKPKFVSVQAPVRKAPEQRLVLPKEVGCPGLKERWCGGEPALPRCSLM